MVGAGRAVDEIPGLEWSLLFFDQEQALPGKDEEIFLRGLAVVSPARLAWLQDADGKADLREGDVVALEDEGVSEDLVRHPAAVADVHDEPAFGCRGEAALGLFEPRFFDHVTATP